MQEFLEALWGDELVTMANANPARRLDVAV
jgi:hypothetical protein